MRVCVCAGVHACVCACLHVCVHTCACIRVPPPDVCCAGGGEHIPSSRGGGVCLQQLAAAGRHGAQHGLSGSPLSSGPAVQQGRAHPPVQDEAWRESRSSFCLVVVMVVVVLVVAGCLTS